MVAGTRPASLQNSRYSTPIGGWSAGGQPIVTAGSGRHGADAAHVAKRKRRPGAAVVFDAKARKEYVTGFHKRKQARRKEGMKQLEDAEKKEIQERKREAREAKLMELAAGADSEDEADEVGGAGGGVDAGPSEVNTAYELSGACVTVTTTTLEPSGTEAEVRAAEQLARKRAREAALKVNKDKAEEALRLKKKKQKKTRSKILLERKKGRGAKKKKHQKK